MSEQPSADVSTLQVTWAGRRLRIAPTASPVRIGRARDADVPIGEETVSRDHLQVVWENDSWVAVDQSKRGTYTAEGQRVSRVAVGAEPVILRLSAADGAGVQLASVSGARPSAPPTSARCEELHQMLRDADTAEATAGPEDVDGNIRRPLSLWRTLGFAGPWSLRRILVLAIGALVGGVITWLVNIWLIVRHYELPGREFLDVGSAEFNRGISYLPESAPVAMRPEYDPENFRYFVHPNPQGWLFTFLLAAVLSAIVMNLVILGPRPFFRRVTALPSQLRSIPWCAGRGWALSAMLGAGVALMLGAVVIPATRGTLGVAILVFLPTALGRIASVVLARIMVTLSMRAAQSATNLEARAGAAVLGAGVGFLIGAFPVPLRVRLIAAVVLILIPALARGGMRPKAALTALIVLAVAFVAIEWLLDAAPVLADDEGYQDCTSENNVSGWSGYWQACGREFFGDRSWTNTVPPFAGGWWFGGRGAGVPPTGGPPSRSDDDCVV